MSIKLLTSPDDFARYDVWVKSHPQGNLWQSLEWKNYQESLGREVRIYTDEQMYATALIVIDRTSFGLSTWDCPRGPLMNIQNAAFSMQNFLRHVLADAKKDTCLSFYFSPVDQLPPTSYLLQASSRHEQPDATRILDLTQSDDELLAQMHQKGRYNINVAKKNGVRIEHSTDVDAYYELAQKTGKRDAFGIPSKRQLKAFLEKLPGSFLLLAYTSNNPQLSTLNSQLSPVAGLLGVVWKDSGIYYYGASDYEHRALMAPYLLQWEAMQLCKKAGCTTYDLLGIAPIDAKADHPWNGISDFKSKFGGTVITYPPEQEITLRPMAKRLLETKRKILG